MRCWLFALVPVAIAVNCSPGPTAPTRPRAQAAPCCRDFEQVRALDGARVEVSGVYRPVVLRKRLGPLQSAPAGSASAVSIELQGGISVMLEVYYGPRGTRSVEEIERYSGRRVRVIGRLHAFTPTQVAADGTEMQTMIGPYLGELELIEPAR